MNPNTVNRIGIIGGTFNPVHTGHIILARQFREMFALNETFFVPANISPFKINEPASATTPEQRLDMLKLAIAGSDEFKIDTFELDTGGVSYTIDTVRHFRALYPDGQIYMLIGDDQAENFKLWKNWEDILKEVHLCIAGRGLLFDSAYKNRLLTSLTVGQKSPKTINNCYLDVSSSEIREKIAEGKDVSHLLNEKVYEFIKLNNLYYK